MEWNLDKTSTRGFFKDPKYKTRSSKFDSKPCYYGITNTNLPVLYQTYVHFDDHQLSTIYTREK
jgi:hypothetical protein